MNETTPYFYVKNLMGDICEIVDKNGATVATYQYDAWGNILNSEGDATILQLNPFTYRGYIYDSETKLYYLQTRYYNPEWNRFINADTNLDTQTSIVGTNVFAYCSNNPVMQTDPTGQKGEFENWMINSSLTPGERLIFIFVCAGIAEKFNISENLLMGVLDGLAKLGNILTDIGKLIYDVLFGDTISIISSIIEFGHSLIYVLGSKGIFDRAAGGIYSGIISSFTILLNLGPRLMKAEKIDNIFIRDTVLDFIGAAINVFIAVIPGIGVGWSIALSTIVPKVITIVGRAIWR